ncbi:MAG: glycosyltransferase, partial [Lachnospiraceae bacterium]|nr:glycosyltransferase [Lachnospiraceae bacterium]
MAEQGTVFFRIIKTLDTELRMRYLHKKMDGVITISEFLFQYYHNLVKTIKVPPLVDKNEKKWKAMPEDRGEGLRLVYAGSPSSQKECLDLIVKAVEEFSPKHKVELVIAGITLSEFNSIYHMNYAGNSVKFLGKIENNKVISLLKSADYSIIIRENNRVVQAGFPTKIVESISAGT